jgi:hypothetical protein
MRCELLVVIFTTTIVTVSGFDPDLEMEQIPDEEARARIYLDYLDKEFSKRSTQSALAEWAYASNITDETLKNKVRYVICGLLGNYTALCGNYLPTFRDNVSAPSSRVKIPRRKSWNLDP